MNTCASGYDPALGRFLSPDPYVQVPDFSQNFNRYSYCLNNPLKYNDPSGQFWSLFTAAFEWTKTVVKITTNAYSTAFLHGGLDPFSSSSRKNAWDNFASDYKRYMRDFDPTRSGSKTNNAFKIDIGLLRTDPNRSFWYRAGQFASRFTWESAQTWLGNGISQVRNITGEVADVSYYGGATLVNKKDISGDRWGFTLGPYINSKNLVADPYTDDMFRHEYGHTLQSRLLGPLYLTSVAVPSLVGGFLDYNLGINNHDREWYETQANRMSERYFRKHDPGALTALPWDDSAYPRKYSPSLYWIFAHPPLPFAWWLFF